MEGFILGRAIVSDVLATKDITPYLDAGFGLDFMAAADSQLDDPYRMAFTSVFSDQDIDAWLFILRHHARHSGRVPDLALFRESYPESAYALSTADVTAAELLERAEHAVDIFRSEVASAEAGRHIDAGDPHGAALIFRDVAAQILNKGTESTIKVTVDDASFDLEAYLAKEVKRGPGFGLRKLDTEFSGFQPGHLVTLLGRAKANKTTFLIQSAFWAWFGQEVSTLGSTEVVDPMKVMFVSTEIDAEGVQGRFLAYGAEVNPRYLTERTGNYRLDEPNGIRAVGKVREFWDDEIMPTDSKSLRVIQPTSRYTIADLEMDVESFGADIVYLDGFYFLTDPITGRPGSHWEAHDNLARDLKAMAMRRKIPVVLTHQVREKQVGKAGGGLDDGSMMGGTGLRMASDLVLTLDKELDSADDTQDGVITMKTTASRSGYLPTIQGRWVWKKFRFQEEEYEEEEVYENVAA